MPRHATVSTLSILGVMTAALAGCPIWGDGPRLPPPLDAVTVPGPDASDAVQQPDVRPRTCATNAECATNQYCNVETHECVNAVPCTSGNTCAIGYYCDARNNCVPGCDTNSDCTAPQECNTTSHQCVAGGQCHLNTDCAVNESCVDGSCRANSSVCQFNYQCAAGHQCVDGACVSNCAGTGTSTCLGGQVCVNGSCTTPAGSCDAVTCTGGTVCSAGQCVPQCTLDTQCATGFYCASGACRIDDRRPPPFCTPPANGCAAGSTCVDGVCRISCAATPTDAYCMSVDFQFTHCDTTGGNICRYSAEVSPQCARATDCPSGQTCVNARCQ